jgi:ureidoacrylate peracid hydrolase
LGRLVRRERTANRCGVNSAAVRHLVRPPVQATSTLSRDVPLVAGRCALLFVDTQNYNCRPDGGQYRDLSAKELERTYGYFFATLYHVAVPNWIKLQTAFRAAGIEVLYTVIQSLTADGRDRSLDYKISGFHIPPNSDDSRVIDALEPGPDEMVIPKTSSSVFISTNIDYVLRNLGVASLVVAGVLTDQCIDSTLRDACDLGYLVSVVTDACATLTRERHESSLRNNAGYARQISTEALVAEVAALTAAQSI